MKDATAIVIAVVVENTVNFRLASGSRQNHRNHHNPHTHMTIIITIWRDWKFFTFSANILTPSVSGRLFELAKIRFSRFVSFGVCWTRFIDSGHTHWSCLMTRVFGFSNENIQIKGSNKCPLSSPDSAQSIKLAEKTDTHLYFVSGMK